MTYDAITRPWQIGAALAGAVALLAVGGCGGEATTAPSPSTVTVVSTETTTATPTESPTAATEPAPGSPTASTPNDEATFLMPNLVGQVLQTAQDEMQRVSGNPIFYTSSTDATGAGRRQVLDRNWVVCSQSVPPGTVVSVHGSTIDFGVVKKGETCP